MKKREDEPSLLSCELLSVDGNSSHERGAASRFVSIGPLIVHSALPHLHLASLLLILLVSHLHLLLLLLHLQSLLLFLGANVKFPLKGLLIGNLPPDAILKF